MLELKLNMIISIKRIVRKNIFGVDYSTTAWRSQSHDFQFFLFLLTCSTNKNISDFHSFTGSSIFGSAGASAGFSFTRTWASRMFTKFDWWLCRFCTIWLPARLRTFANWDLTMSMLGSFEYAMNSFFESRESSTTPQSKLNCGTFLTIFRSVLTFLCSVQKTKAVLNPTLLLRHNKASYFVSTTAFLRIPEPYFFSCIPLLWNATLILKKSSSRMGLTWKTATIWEWSNQFFTSRAIMFSYGLSISFLNALNFSSLHGRTCSFFA